MKLGWTRTLLGAVSSLIVWAVHFTAVYSLVGVGCDQGWDRHALAASNLLTVSILAATVPALALIAWIGWGGWRGLQSAQQADIEADTRLRWRFMGWLTLTAALLAFVSTLMTAVPSVMLPPCET